MEEAEKCGAVRRGANVVARAAFRLSPYPSVERGDDQSRNRTQKKGLPPSEARTKFPPGKVAKRRAYRNGEVEDGENPVSFALRVEVGEHGRGINPESGLAHANQRVPDIKRPVAMHPGGSQRRQAPKHRTGHDQGLTPETVAKPASERGREHVADEERRGERA